MRKLLITLAFFSLAGCGTQQKAPAGSLDAVGLLHIGSQSTIALPDTQDSGSVMVRYGGWSLNELAQSDAGKKYIRFVQDDAVHAAWADAKSAPGVYQLQKGKPVPVAVLASALLADLVKNGAPRFDGPISILWAMTDDTHCKDSAADTYIGLYWSEDTLDVDTGYCSVQGGGIWEATR